MYVYVDESNRVTAFNPNDLSGNTGWIEAEGESMEPIEDEHGVPLYKLENGHIVARTEAEIAADVAEMAGEDQPTTPAPTLESRVDTLEGDSAEMREALNMILEGVVE